MNTMDEEWDDTSDVIDCECDHCDKVTKCILSSDPYMSEVYPDEPRERSRWCKSCYCKRKDDI